MKIVKVEVLPIRDGETVSATIIQEQKKGEAWNRVKAWDVESGTPDASRRVMLDDNERLVIEGRSSTVTVFDQAQNAAVPMPRDPAAAERKAREELAQREQNIADEQRRNRESEELALKKTAEAPKTNIGNPAPTTQPTVPPRPTSQSTPAPTKPAQPGAAPAAVNKPQGPGLGGDTGQGARDSKEVKK